MSPIVHYLANARIPTEKAHGLQIVQNCEALAESGADVTLIVPRRLNRAFAGIDPWTHYGVRRGFALVRLACLDLFPLGRWLEPLAVIIETLSFTIAVLLRSRNPDVDLFYSRDPILLLAVSMVKPASSLVYEAHQESSGRIGKWIQRTCLRRVGVAFAVTQGLASTLADLGGRPVTVLRDGFQRARFRDLSDERGAGPMGREAVAERPFSIGYVGRLETMGMSKGLDDVIDAIARLNDPTIHLWLVGGPAASAEALRTRWLQRNLARESLHITGDVAPATIPGYLFGFDVCVLPLPATPHFARCASPLKLFEYMAAGRAIIASRLPAIAEVLTDGDTGVLVPPEDAESLAEAIRRLRANDRLRQDLGRRARHAVEAFSWDARARRILDAVGQPVRP